jgi:biotin synthase
MAHFAEGIMRGLGSLGISADFQRKNDIEVNGRKIEKEDLPCEAISFNITGEITRLDAPELMVEVAVNTGLPFMTDGCPDRNGKMACNRPYGSYRPGEEYRDYPFLPGENDLIIIRQQMRLDEVWSNLYPVPA